MEYFFVGYVNKNGLSGVTNAQAKKLTHLNIAFAPMVGDITFLELDKHQIFELNRIKNANKSLNILVSTGGGDNKGHGSATKTKEGIEKLTNSTIEIVKKYDLSGIDCDWEFPCDTGISEEKFQHTELLKVYREKLDILEKEHGKKYFLTTAAACGQWYIDSTEIEKSHKYLDFLNLMTYDLNMNTNITGHHTSLYPSKFLGAKETQSADYNIKLLVNLGIPIQKILMGVAFYSRRWDNVENNQNGIYQKSTLKDRFGPFYDEILLKYENKSDYIKYFDENAKAPFLFNGCSFITYDDPMSVKYKLEYVKENKMKGAFYWVHDSDKTSTLFDTMYDGLN